MVHFSSLFIKLKHYQLMLEKMLEILLLHQIQFNHLLLNVVMEHLIKNVIFNISFRI